VDLMQEDKKSRIILT